MSGALLQLRRLLDAFARYDEAGSRSSAITGEIPAEVDRAQRAAE